MSPQSAPKHHRRPGQILEITLFELIEQVSSAGLSEAETVAVVSDLINSGSARMTGTLRGRRVQIV